MKSGDGFMSSLIKGTHHVSVKAPDMATYEKALDFYGNVLGLKVIRTWDTDSSPYIMFDTGNNIIELSADGPMREPYNVYLQGGLTYSHARLGVLSSLSRMKVEGLANI